MVLRRRGKKQGEKMSRSNVSSAEKRGKGRKRKKEKNLLEVKNRVEKNTCKTSNQNAGKQNVTVTDYRDCPKRWTTSSGH
jgi:hypothetical protein